MLGLFLQFQLLNYYQIDLFEEADISTLFNQDTTFRDFVLNIPNRDAQDLLSYYYNIDEISDYPLLSFFAPLDEYLDIAPMEQASYKLKTPKFVRTTTTTTTAAPKIKKTRFKPKDETTTTQKSTTINQKSGVKQIADNLNEKPKVAGVTNVKQDAKTLLKDDEENLTPVQSPVHLGIYIGAGIVVVTLAIIAAGFVTQRRRTQRNNRRYNA